jgi:hypothetical protein
MQGNISQAAIGAKELGANKTGLWERECSLGGEWALFCFLCYGPPSHGGAVTRPWPMRLQTMGIKQGTNCGTFTPGQLASPYKLYMAEQIRTLDLRVKLNLNPNGSPQILLKEFHSENLFQIGANCILQLRDMAR